MRIAIDVDDTITNSYDVIFDLLGKVYNKDSDKLKADGVTYYDVMADNVNFPDYDKFTANNFDAIMPNVPLKKDAKEVINKLHEEGHQIIIMTARSDKEYSNPYVITYLYLVKNDIINAYAANEISNGLEYEHFMCKNCQYKFICDGISTNEVNRR